jgi:hypothetical protein
MTVVSAELSWDGVLPFENTCGDAVTCLDQGYLPPGQYTAKMCATPGDMVQADPEDPESLECVPSGPEECVEVPFSFPDDGLVVGTLD